MFEGIYMDLPPVGQDAWEEGKSESESMVAQLGEPMTQADPEPGDETTSGDEGEEKEDENWI